MKRREALAALLAFGASYAPLHARAQQAPRIRRIGVPWLAPRATIEHLIAALEQGLRERGYVNGRDIAIEHRFADNKIERLPELVQELVRSEVDVIVTGINAQTAAAQAATRTIPIVMAFGSDVVGQGFVASYARPGGNITGLTWEMGAGASVKRLELLKEVAPRVSHVAVLFDPPGGGRNSAFRRALDDAAAALRLNLIWGDITDDFERGMAAALRKRPDALYWSSGARQNSRRAEAVALSAKHRLPASYFDAVFVDIGGLMSYGPNSADLVRRTGAYVDRILKGAKPGDLPVEQPTRLDLAINLKTAKVLGLAVPQSLLLRADRVIE